MVTPIPPEEKKEWVITRVSKESEYRNPERKEEKKKKTRLERERPASPFRFRCKAKSLRSSGPLDNLQSTHHKHEGGWEDPDNVTLEQEFRHSANIDIIDLTDLRQLQG